MYKIIVLNQTGNESYSREYNAFISALCLARMGHDVLYIGNTRFAGEFYQGGHTKDVNIFDIDVPESPAMLPVGFEMFPVEKLDIEMITDQRLREHIISFGRTDIVFYSGNEYMVTFAQQVAKSKQAVTCPLDWQNEPPCVNEIQLSRTRGISHPPARRVVSFSEYAWIDEGIKRIRQICDWMGEYELWLVAQYPSSSISSEHEKLQSENIYWQPSLSDSGRFILLQSAHLYVEPNQNLNKQGIAEALCAGIPVIAQSSEMLTKTFGTMVNEYPQCKPVPSWVKIWEKEQNEHITGTARKFYGFSERIVFLHNIIKNLEC